MSDHEDIFHVIAANICNKPRNLTAEQCFSHTINSLCHNRQKCRIYEKSLEQLKYVQQSISENTFLRACPGSGKTEVVGLKAAKEIKLWPHSHKGIAVLTFTNNAASEIAERITQFTGSSGTSYPHYIGTIDSWLHGYIANPFAHLRTCFPGEDGDRSIKIIETGYNANWLNPFKAPTPYLCQNGSQTPIYANDYYFDLETELFYIHPLGGNQWITHKELYDSPLFTRFRENKDWLTEEYLCKKFWETKEKFWKSGFCTYQDIELLCYSILHEFSNIADIVSKRFPLIIVDECQDLSWIQLRVLEILQDKGSILHFVGDLNQGIYSFKKVFPSKIRTFVDEKKFSTLSLNKNFRSLQPIVDLCGKLCDQGTIVGRTINGHTQPCCVLFTYSTNRLKGLPEQFSDYLLANGLSNINSAILARGKSLISKLQAGLNEEPLTKAELPTQAIFLWKTHDWERQRTALQYIGKYIATIYFSTQHMNSRNQYCPDVIESKIHWRAFLASVLKACTQIPELVNSNQAWSQWSRAFNEHFHRVILATAEEHELTLEDIESSYRSPSGKASTLLENYITEISISSGTSNISITTIHQVKGETHDATLLVSSPDKRGGRGGHWSEWLGRTDDDGEHARFAYVASSRPKYLLAWAIPDTDTDGIERLQALGFIRKDLEG